MPSPQVLVLIPFIFNLFEMNFKRLKTKKSASFEVDFIL
jgi:hypothetical protein